MSAKILTGFAVCLSAGTVAVALCLSPQAIAQQRAPNAGAAGILRAWPGNGEWQVGLVRLLDGALGCLLVTGYANQASGERYFWGMRLRDQSLAVEIIDNNERAMAASSIKIVIDQVQFGTYQVTRRLGPEGGFRTVLAELPSQDGQRLMGLIGVAGAIQFVTMNSTYSAPLQGARQSMQSLQECMTEATHLSSVSGPR
jgi:hypothetical protein